MTDRTRRDFLRHASLGAVVVGAGAALPLSGMDRAAATTPRATKAADTSLPEFDEPVVAYLRDLSRGEVTLMVGDRHITRHDPALAASLARAARP